MKTLFSINKVVFAFIIAIFGTSCVSSVKSTEKTHSYIYGESGNGSMIKLRFDKGTAHNHPLLAIWLADENGAFLQTLYISESIGKGIFKRVNRSSGMWQAGEIQRPAALPYWTHARNIKNEKGTLLPTPEMPEVDAYTGATPLTSFEMTLFTHEKLAGKYRLYLELNQSWDWNDFWTNNKYPDNAEYKTSSQPAVVYMAEFDSNNAVSTELKPIGHSHYAGENGNLFTDMSTITTALNIAKKITISVVP